MVISRLAFNLVRLSDTFPPKFQLQTSKVGLSDEQAQMDKASFFSHLSTHHIKKEKGSQVKL
jgi:hypothetical protein